MENSRANAIVLSDVRLAAGPLRIVLLAAGWLCLALGMLGVLLPILPAAPLLLLAVACFARSSPSMAERIYRMPVAGKYLRDWQDGGISPRMKWLALIMLWLTAAWTLVVLAKTALLKTVVLLITILASLHFLFMPTADKADNNE